MFKKGPPLDPILSHLNSVHNLTFYWFKIHFNIILPSGHLRSDFPPKVLCEFLILHMHGICPAHIILLDLSTIITGAAVAQSVWWLTTDWTTGVRSPTGAEDFSSSPCVQTASGAHPASCTVGTGGLFPGSKARPERETDHSPPSSAEVKNE
jgi:hypothetical protein